MQLEAEIRRTSFFSDYHQSMSYDNVKPENTWDFKADESIESSESLKQEMNPDKVPLQHPELSLKELLAYGGSIQEYIQEKYGPSSRTAVDYYDNITKIFENPIFGQIIKLFEEVIPVETESVFADLSLDEDLSCVCRECSN